MANRPKPGPGLHRAIPDLVSVKKDEVSDVADAPAGTKLRDPFHSAVNRIPLLRPSLLSTAGTDSDLDSFYGDGAPIGHDSLALDRWSGSFVLEMIVQTPVVFGEEAVSRSASRNAQETSREKRVSLPFSLYLDGSRHMKKEFFIPPTAIKGMISRQYEILTASRFRVFGDHKTPLTYRADVAEAGPLLLARVVKTKDTLAVKYPSSLRAEVYSIPDTPEIAKALSVDLQQLRKTLKHGSKVTVLVKESEEGKQYVCGLADKGQKGDLEGYVFRVAAEGVGSEDFRPKGSGRTEERTSQDDSGGKKYEKLVVVGTEEKSKVSVLSAEQIVRYERVLLSYLREHAEREPTAADRKEEWERSLNRAASELLIDPKRTLQNGDFVFMVPRGPKGKKDFSRFDIVPTMVGRRSYDIAPWTLAAEQKVLPLSRKEEASPADRLFGYVVDKLLHADDGLEDVSPHSQRPCVGDVAYRGRLSFSEVVLTQDDVVTNSPQLLPPLLSAKLGSARRFITDGKGATPNKGGRALRRSEYFPEASRSGRDIPDSQRQLLGIATFPVHRHLVEQDGFPSWEDVDTNDCGLDASNSDVRLVAENWIRSGAVLKCRVDFSNLNGRELSALLWLLEPENLVPDTERDKKGAKGFLRLGLGKPLGLGALEVRVQEGSLCASRGAELHNAYQALTGCLGDSGDSAVLSELPVVVDAAMRREPWVQAMLRSAFGYDGEYPVRYMTLTENRDNNKTDSEGNPKPGAAISPRVMWGPYQAKPLQVIDLD